jgi:hypothetical protein
LSALALVARPARAARVEELALREGATPAVELRLSEAVAPDVHRLSNPSRVYVDLHDTTVAPTVARALEGSGAVRKVRVGQFDAHTVRIVVELAKESPVDVGAQGGTITLTVGSGAAARAEAPTKVARPPSAEAVSAAATVTKRAPAKAESAKAAKIAATAGGAARAKEPPIDEPRLTVVQLDDAPRVGAPPESVASSSPTANAPLVARPALVASNTSTIALQERIARRVAAEDWAGVVVLYGANPTAIRRDVDSATRASVIDALRELGLGYTARKLLGPADGAEAPALRIARAELDARGGQVEDATAALVGIDEVAVDPALVPKLRRLRARLALARGDLDGASTSIGTRAMPELRAEVAHAALEAGRSAMDKRVCRRAVVAYRQALDVDGGRTARTAAAAGLVRAALSCRDADATMQGLGVLAESPHPLLRRAASVIAATQTEDARETAIKARSKRGG